MKWFWTVLAAGLVFVASVVPVPEVPELQDVPLMDKWVHFVMYGGVCLACWLDRLLQWRRQHGGWGLELSSGFVAFTALFPSLLGGGLELWQAYLTTCRSGEWLDWVADMVGVVLAEAVAAVVVLRMRRYGRT